MLDPRPFTGAAFPPAEPNPFAQGFPFTIGATAGGLQPSDVSVSFARPGVGNATAQQFQQMTLSFTGSSLSRGAGLAFGIDRDEAVTFYPEAREGNGADVLGGITLFPEGQVLTSGLSYTAELSNGRTNPGQLHNRIGRGWTPVDGHGFINAERAVEGR